MGTRDYLPRVKRVEREADDSAPFSDKVKNAGAIPPLPIRLSGVLLNYLSTGTNLLFLPSDK
jgi:hypothetical protein